MLADLSYLADEIGPVGPDWRLVAAVAFAVLGGVAFGAVAGWRVGRLDLEERRADKAAAEERERRAAQLQRVGLPGQHRKPPPEVLHEEPTVNLGAYRLGGGVRWH